MGLQKVSFKRKRGSNKGIPLSHFLFLQVAEALGRMIKWAVRTTLFEGFRVARNSQAISHLQLANDTLIFCGENEDHIRNVKAILLCFEVVSGLEINFLKSELIGIIRTEKSKLLQYAEILGCKAGDLPASYLGLPLCLGPVSKSMWNPVVERVERKLSTWKASYLSMRGRVTLIKAVLLNLPIYYFSLFKCLNSVIKRIERLQREFLWYGNSTQRKYHLIDWESICKPKEEGGLGIRPLKQMNQALWRKWLWRIGEESDGLWRQVLEMKYGLSRNGWDIQDATKLVSSLERNYLGQKPLYGQH